MPSVHQTPVLDIAVDAVSKLDGDAELRGLWAVVTKCKDSLRQGRRLENLSWRLWYREMAHQHPCDDRMSPFAARVPSALPPLSSCSSAEESDNSDLWTSDDDGNSPSDHSKPTVSVVSRTTSAARPSHRLASVASASRSEPSPSATRPLTHDSQRSISVPCRTGSGSSSDRPRVNVGLVISSLLPQRLDVDYERATLAAASSVTTQGAQFVYPTPTTPAKPPAVVLVRPTPRASPPPASPIFESYDPTSSRSTLSPESAAQPLAPPRPPVPESVTLPTESKPVVVESRPSPPAQADANSSVSSGARSQSKGKDTVRNPAPTGKSASGKHVVAARRVAALGRTGASSSTGRIARPALTRSNTGGNKSQRSASPHAPAPPAAKQTSPKDLRRVSVATASSSASKKRTASPKVLALLAQPQRRRGVEVITSSDFETTDEDDSSWASESEEAEQRDNTATREAALAAARQADMFAKLPERSYSNLNVHKKPGLLTHLFHPDPNILPQGHPYRATLSAQDLVRRSSSTAGNSSAPSPAPRPQFRRAPSALGVSKSPVAGPVGSFVNAEGGAAIQGHATREAALAAAAVRPPLLRQKTAPPVIPDNGKGKAPAAAKPSSGGGYVSKGRPQDVEMESDSDDDPTDKIQLSQSVAQARLAALADPKHRAALAARQTQRISDPLPVSEQAAASSSQEDDDEIAYTPSAPIMLPHPYNLPPPMEPQTPRTIRLQMLSREMSESLRRNLLWERRVSKQAPRRQVGLIKPRTGSDGEEIPRDPGMYALPSQRNLVRMRSELQQPGQKRMEQMQNERVTQMLKAHALLQPPPRQPGESEMEARSRIMRHRSFAGEYHAHGW